MRHDSVFYDIEYPADNSKATEEEKTTNKPKITFNDNIVLASLDSVKETKHPGMYDVIVSGKGEPIQIPELSIVAHLDEVQQNIEMQITLQDLVKAKEAEIFKGDDDDQEESKEEENASSDELAQETKEESKSE